MNFVTQLNFTGMDENNSLDEKARSHQATITDACTARMNVSAPRLPSRDSDEVTDGISSNEDFGEEMKESERQEVESRKELSLSKEELKRMAIQQMLQNNVGASQMIQILTRGKRCDEFMSKECQPAFEEPEFLVNLVKNYSQNSTYNSDIIEIGVNKLLSQI